MKDISEWVNVERVTPKKGNYFFGYYDISPEDPTGRYALVQKAPFNDHMPSEKDELEIGYIDLNTRKYHLIDKTTAWNFQEGCRLQWINEKEVIYNIRSEGAFSSVVYDIIQKKRVRSYNVAVYSVSRDKKYAVTYSFVNNRYCYAHNSSQEKIDYDHDGIFLINLNTGERRLVISLTQLSTLTHTGNYKNWVEHCVFNPLGNSFFFYHRWNDNKGNMHSRFCVSDLKGDIKILISDGFCSHASWENDYIITAWGRLPTKVNSIQRNKLLINTGLYRFMVDVYHKIIKKDSIRQRISNDAYIRFNISKGQQIKIRNNDFTTDGHPSWNKSATYMITDTYPNSENLRMLMVYNKKNNDIILLGKFFSYPDIRDKMRYSIVGIRCDLHPKWTYREKYIYFDSTHEGFRGLYRINIEKVLLAMS